MSSKNSLKHIYTKTFTIVANESYEIPSLELKYFDKELGILTKTASMHYTIHVGKEKVGHIKKHDKKNILYVLLSIFMMSLLYFRYKKFSFKREPLHLLEKLSKVNNGDELYKVLVPYLTKNRELDILIYALEDDNYRSFRKNKKRAKSLVKMMYKFDIITSHKEF